jgi:NhaP-type Na+/H+ or K+/H+ antiporter
VFFLARGVALFFASTTEKTSQNSHKRKNTSYKENTHIYKETSINFFFTLSICFDIATFCNLGQISAFVNLVFGGRMGSGMEILEKLSKGQERESE